jgi:hypothetical protein
MSNFTLSELIDHLQGLIEYEGVSPDAEVLIAYQPRYPMEVQLADVTFIERNENDESSDEMQGTVYLAASDNNDYSTSQAWEGGVITKEDLN